jgi:hypothetical protein
MRIALEIRARKIANAPGGLLIDDIFQLKATAHELMVECHKSGFKNQNADGGHVLLRRLNQTLAPLYTAPAAARKGKKQQLHAPYYRSGLRVVSRMFKCCSTQQKGIA